MLSACVSAVKCRPVLHHRVVIFFGPQESWIVCCLHLEIESRSCIVGGVSGVESFITTDDQLQLNRGCCSSMQAMLSEGFPFFQFHLYTVGGS